MKREVVARGVLNIAREIFVETDIPHARGIDELSHSTEELVQRIATLYRVKPVQKMVIKLDQGTPSFLPSISFLP
jgi:hypothetical protein